jgi:hypothetical protein
MLENSKISKRYGNVKWAKVLSKAKLELDSDHVVAVVEFRCLIMMHLASEYQIHLKVQKRKHKKELSVFSRRKSENVAIR